MAGAQGTAVNFIKVFNNKGESKTYPLPDYGEIKIVCHDGKIKTVETTIKNKID